MIKEYNDYFNKNIYKLYIDDDISENIDWDIVMDFSDLWGKYLNKELDIKSFIIKFKHKINEYKNTLISKKSLDIWNELVIILNNFKNYEPITMHKKMNEFYNWADKNNIKIKTK